LWLNFEIRKSIHAIERKTLTFTPNSYQIKIESTIIEELSHKAQVNYLETATQQFISSKRDLLIRIAKVYRYLDIPLNLIT